MTGHVQHIVESEVEFVVTGHERRAGHFTSDELHLGEISLECSRAGAAAGALWCTLRALPIKPDEGLGPVLKACLRAARRWADQVSSRDTLNLVAQPETDIVAYYPTPRTASISAIDEASNQLFQAAMHDSEEPIFTSLYRVPAETLTSINPELEKDQSEVAVLRSVLMKPEHEDYARTLVDRLHTVTTEKVNAAID